MSAEAKAISCMIVFSLIVTARGHSLCTGIYGEEPCRFLPAPPGKTPPCAQPGLTYCEHPDHYPGQRIHYLIQKWRFDHSTLILDESKEEFTSYFYPPPTYKYGPSNAIKSDSYYPEPIYIPKPAFNFDHHIGNQYIPPNNFTGYPDRRPPANGQHLNFKYSNNIPPYSSYSPAQDLYSAFGLPHVNNPYKSWGRKEDRYEKALLIRRKRSEKVSARLRQLNSLNGTDAVQRTKRQSALAGQTLCTARSQFIMPRAALNNKGNWMYVVNMPDNRFTQLVKSETCVSQTCSNLCGLPVGYTSRCEQKYVQKRLVALEGAGNELYSDVFWFPSCCVCTISNS